MNLKQFKDKHDLTTYEAFRRGWCSYTANSNPTREEEKRILDEATKYQAKEKASVIWPLPHYMVRFLEKERKLEFDRECRKRAA